MLTISKMLQGNKLCVCEGESWVKRSGIHISEARVSQFLTWPSCSSLNRWYLSEDLEDFGVGVGFGGHMGISREKCSRQRKQEMQSLRQIYAC